MAKGKCVRCGNPWGNWDKDVNHSVDLCDPCRFHESTGLDANTHPEEYGRWCCRSLPSYDDHLHRRVVNGKIAQFYPSL